MNVKKRAFVVACPTTQMTRISNVTTITFWVTHQHSPTPENNYSLKHTSFFMIWGSCRGCMRIGCALTQPPDPSVRWPCSYMVSKVIERAANATILFFCILHLLLEPMQQSLHPKCFSSLVLVIPELYKGQTCKEKRG